MLRLRSRLEIPRISLRPVCAWCSLRLRGESAADGVSVVATRTVDLKAVTRRPRPLRRRYFPPLRLLTAFQNVPRQDSDPNRPSPLLAIGTTESSPEFNGCPVLMGGRAGCTDGCPLLRMGVPHCPASGPGLSGREGVVSLVGSILSLSRRDGGWPGPGNTPVPLHSGRALSGIRNPWLGTRCR
jgi:hypothetical protein